MIPREILKKIRQIELCPNRIVTESADGGCVRSTSRSTPEFSNALTNHHALRLGLRPQLRSKEELLQPSPQFRRIPRTMPDGKNFHFAVFLVDGEVNRVRPRRWNFRLPSSGGRAKKSFGLMSKGIEDFTKRHVQPMTDSRLALVIPNDGFMPVLFGVGIDYRSEEHTSELQSR